MSDVKITVGGAIEDDAARRFVDAWHRAERGESFRERNLAFESWDALARILSGKRMELLGYVRRHKVASVRALAKALGRDYSNVHADVHIGAAPGSELARSNLRAVQHVRARPWLEFRCDSGNRQLHWSEWNAAPIPDLVVRYGGRLRGSDRHSVRQ